MTEIFHDLRYALRSLRIQAGFSRVVIATIALAAGANTAIFTLLYALLWNPVAHVEDPATLALVSMSQPRLGIEGEALSVPDYVDLAAGCSSCAEMATFDDSSMVLQTGEGAQRLEGVIATPSLFSVLGVEPAVGRVFRVAEGQPGGDRVAVISHRLWEEELGGSRSVVGSAVTVNGRPTTVVGVMPEGFRFPEVTDLWLPLVVDLESSRSNRYTEATLARLAPGHTLDEVEAELAAAAEGLAARYPETNAGWSVRLAPFREALVNEATRKSLLLAQGAVFFVLLIAAANVANLLLAREVSRQREVAVRLALGAGRWQVMRQLILECLLLALAGGALGLGVARWSLDWLLASNPEPWPSWLDFSMHWPVLAASFLLAVVVGLLVGLLPALRAGRPQLVSTLKEGGSGAAGGRSRQRWQRALVTAEVALAVVVLFGAFLLVRTFVALLNGDPGFETEKVLVARTYLPEGEYPAGLEQAAVLDQVLERVRALPGVAGAAFTGAVPADDGGGTTTIRPEGHAFDRDEAPRVVYVGSTPGFFEALNIPIYEGRGFTAEEGLDPETDAVILNRTLAETLWPEGGAVGRRLRLGDGEDWPWRRVVGVVGSLQYEEFGEDGLSGKLQVHLPYAAAPWRRANLMVRAEGPPAALSPQIRAEIRAVDPALAVWDVRTMDEVLAYTSWGQRILGQIFAYFAFIAVLLGALGIYGVMAYSVSQRKHEIGIRLALGASGEEVMRQVMSGGLALGLVGWGLGILGALGAARLLQELLWGVNAYDPASLVLVSVIILLVTALACYAPARRAARVSPVEALRAD